MMYIVETRNDGCVLDALGGDRRLLIVEQEHILSCCTRSHVVEVMGNVVHHEMARHHRVTLCRLAFAQQRIHVEGTILWCPHSEGLVGVEQVSVRNVSALRIIINMCSAEHLEEIAQLCIRLHQLQERLVGSGECRVVVVVPLIGASRENKE